MDVMEVLQRLEELVSSTNRRDIFASDIKEQLENGVAPKAVTVKVGVCGYSFMHYACERGWSDLAKLLAQEYDCDPNAMTENQLTPLHYACRYGHIDTTRTLIFDLRCNVRCYDNEQQTPLHYYYYWHKKYTDIVRFLVEAGVDVDKRDILGITVLKMACSSRDAETAQFLISEAHCDVTLSDNNGYTPLHVACLISLTDDIPKLLLTSTTVNVNAKNNDGDSPLHLACKAENLGRIQLLIRDKRCNTRQTNYNGDTALHVACCRFQFNLEEIMKTLLEDARIDPNVKNNDGNTPLHLACNNQYLDVVQAFFKFLNPEAVDVNAQNRDGKTPLDLATNVCMVKELIRHGASPQNVYKNHGKVLGRHSSQQPPQTPVQIFVVGNVSAGKSTLIKAIQCETSRLLSLVTRSRRVSGVDGKTIGIFPHDFQSRIYGCVTLYDFCGQKEFYGAHSLLLLIASRASTPVFLLMVDISESIEDIKHSILYWFSFLENQCTSVGSKPHLVVIGSHANVLKCRGEDPQHKVSFISSLLITPQFSSLQFTGCVLMDCQYADSASMRKLRQILKTSCDVLRTKDSVNFIAHCFFVYLQDNLMNSKALTIGQIVLKLAPSCSQTAKDITGFLPQNIQECVQVCEALNESGHLLILKNPIAVEDSWVIMNQPALLAEINGTIFVPEGFKEHIKLASSTGVVPLSNIAKHFSNYDPTMLVGFLSYFEICHEICDPEILHLIGQEIAISDIQEESYFFFPGLVTLEVPSTVWEPQPQFDYHCGWILQCSRPEQFFCPRFLQVLLLRLAFSFTFRQLPSAEFPSLQRKCYFWKNGICWLDAHGIETLVEIAEHNRVIVLMRCPEVKSECLKLRSLLIQKVLATTHEFCSKVSTVESFINPSDITQYPLKPISALVFYSVPNIAATMAKGLPSVVDNTGKQILVNTLLSFEPYADVGESNLRQLFGENHHEQVNISSIAEHISDNKKEMMKTILNPISNEIQETVSTSSVSPVYHMLGVWRASCEGTYQCLREKLNQFSVFAGRNPLEIAGVPFECGLHPLVMEDTAR